MRHPCDLTADLRVAAARLAFAFQKPSYRVRVNSLICIFPLHKRVRKPPQPSWAAAAVNASVGKSPNHWLGVHEPSFPMYHPTNQT
jgi:hypothetical protein